jgi:hypothetical protein
LDKHGRLLINSKVWSELYDKKQMGLCTSDEIWNYLLKNLEDEIEDKILFWIGFILYDEIGF